VGQRGHAKSRGLCFFYNGKGNEIHQLGIGLFVHHRIISSFMRAELVSDRMSDVVLRGRWCNIIVFKVHASREEKSDDSKESFYAVLEQVFNDFPNYHMTIMLGYFNPKVGREYIFRLTIQNESLHQDSNDNGIRIVNFTTSKNLDVKSMILPHQNIHTYTWTFPDGQTHNQIDHILIDRRWHSSVLYVRSFRVADCDTDYYLVIEKVREGWQ